MNNNNEGISSSSIVLNYDNDDDIDNNILYLNNILNENSNINNHISQHLKPFKIPCKLHENSSNCFLSFVNNKQYHVIAIKNVSFFAQTNFNKSFEVGAVNEFWEELAVGYENCFITTIAESGDLINDLNFLETILNLFKYLDENNLIYSSINSTNSIASSNEMIKKHIIVNYKKQVTFCNKHLIRESKKKSSNLYINKKFVKNLIKSLFPKITSKSSILKNTSGKESIPTSTQNWILQILKS